MFASFSQPPYCYKITRLVLPIEVEQRKYARRTRNQMDFAKKYKEPVYKELPVI